MAQYDELVEALIWLLTNRVQNKINYSHGLLGDGQGRVRVAGNEDFVYARPDRFSSRTQQIFNKRVEGQDGDPIIIGELPWEPGLTQVISIDWRTYKEIGWGGDTTGFTYHGRTHIWKDAAPGLDTFPVYRRQLGDLQATASVSGTNAVDISSYSIELYGAQKQFPGTIGFPLDNAIPGGTGTARMALLYWDPSSGTTGYVGVATGTTGIDSESTLLNRPVSLPGTLPIAFVRLKAGQAGVTEFDIFDAREPFRPGIGFGTGSSQFHAGLIPISDVGGFYTGSSVESALQEIAGGGGGAHDIVGAQHTITAAKWQLVGATAANTLGLITPSSNPGVAEAILKTDSTGEIQLQDLTIASGGKIKAAVLPTYNFFKPGSQWASAADFTVALDTNNTVSTAVFLIGHNDLLPGNPNWEYLFRIGETLSYINTEFQIRNGFDLVMQSGFGAGETGRWDGATGDLTTGGDVQVSSGHMVSEVNGFIVKNTSGAAAVAGDVGYLDASNEYQTTTTAEFETPNPVAVLVGGANNADIYVSNGPGRTTLNYTGSAPSTGDFLTFSAIAGNVQARSTMHPAILARARANGSGGTVEVELLLRRTEIPLISSNDTLLVNGANDSDFVSTIAAAGVIGDKIYYSTVTSGNVNCITPAGSNLGKILIHNTTQSQLAKIIATGSDGTGNFIQVSSSGDISGWSSTDAITARSQTNTSTIVTSKFFDIEITSEIPELATMIYAIVSFRDTGGGQQRVFSHPFASNAASKRANTEGVSATLQNEKIHIVPLISRRFCVAWEASGSGTAVPQIRVRSVVVAT